MIRVRSLPANVLAYLLDCLYYWDFSLNLQALGFQTILSKHFGSPMLMGTRFVQQEKFRL
jgi:hypothetical protein